MSDEKTIDLQDGIALADIPEEALFAARCGDDPLLVFRRGDEVRAFSDKCTHLGAPLHTGLAVDGTVRCPWHHACFSLETGEALAAPAFAPLDRFEVESRDGLVRVKARVPAASSQPPTLRKTSPGPVVIVGAGAGGFAAADRLLRRGYAGPVTVLSDDPAAPYDRTLLTKDFLDGRKTDREVAISRVSLRDLGADVRSGTRVETIDRDRQCVGLADGTALPYAHLILATGATPRRLEVPGADGGRVHLLRTLQDCRAILAGLPEARTVVVVGASFIGTEAAASLRDRKLAVHLVSPEPHPLEKALGRELSDLVVGTHREKGVTLHLGRKVTRIADRAVILDDGTSLDADLVVVGLGVTPRTELAGRAGLTVDDGIVVDDRLRSSDPRIYAVGDVARWPDPHSGPRSDTRSASRSASRSDSTVRIEHWALAQRHGQFVADAILGEDASFTAVPFFWTKQFDLSIRYVGHAEAPDDIEVDGDVAARDATLTYRKAGRRLAVATVGRDKASLEAERAFEQGTGR